MNWPEIVVACLMLYSFVLTIATWSRDRNISNTNLTWRILLYLALTAGYVATLAAGGFW